MLIGTSVPDAAEVGDHCVRQPPRAKVAVGECGVPRRSFRNTAELRPGNKPRERMGGTESLGLHGPTPGRAGAVCRGLSCSVLLPGESSASQASRRGGKGPPRWRGTLAEPSGLQVALPPSAFVTREI